ncbi:sulfite exporter TauE/SafE family protein [Muricoccus radiodurans]|uniref:sulfite exporter TauE/SafE family protein n=1 Tax=Muricoccus radiodurans TaxID=2231721 RepID=UPI003CF8EA66
MLLATLGAALVAGLARGFSGFGAALIFMPLGAALLGPRLAAAVLLLADNLSTLPLLPGAWRRANRREVGAMAAGTLVGTPLGAAILLHLDPTALRWGLSGLVVAMLALLASGWRHAGQLPAPAAAGVGVLSGFCSGAAQMGGPPVVAAWLGGAIPAERVRANIVLFFALSGLVSAVIYLASGLLGGTAVAVAALVLPAYAGGVWLGARMFGLASEARFRAACLILIAFAALLGLPVWDRLRG